jgi:hypothetical protein
MTTSAMQIANTASPAVTAHDAVSKDHGWSFHAILSAMNPLQYLPVVGTIYRAVTGDAIPEPLWRAGSLLVSGLLGGPIGIMTSIAATLAEKITGLDPEKIVTAGFNKIAPAAAASFAARQATPAIPPASTAVPGSNNSLVSTIASTSNISASSTIRQPSTIPATSSASARLAMSPAQLAAYGVRVDPSGNLRLGNIRGADVLNAIELGRLNRAAAAYAAN